VHGSGQVMVVTFVLCLVVCLPFSLLQDISSQIMHNTAKDMNDIEK